MPKEHGDLRAEALLVAAETMKRVARCADVLADRLASRGWKALSGRLRWPPTGEGAATIEAIEGFTAAPLPPSIRAFWEQVGGVDFVWDYNDSTERPDLDLDLDIDELDPLYVDAPETTACQIEYWRDQKSAVDPELDDPFALDLAPDSLHKANISGSSPYGIELPNLGADPTFLNEPHGLPFVDYLRCAVRFGGFPGLEHHADDLRVRRFLSEMTKDLDPF